MDGQLPYAFLLQRVSGHAEEKAKKRRRWRQKKYEWAAAITAPLA